MKSSLVIFDSYDKILNSLPTKQNAMKRFFLLLFLIIIISSCQNHSKKYSDIINIDLETKGTLNPFRIATRPFGMFKDLNSNFKGIIGDSSIVGYTSLTSRKDILAYMKIHDLELETVENETMLYCLSGYQNNKQFYIVDSNYNKDFGDDEYIEFDRTISDKVKSNKDLRKDFPLIKIKMKKIINNQIIESFRTFRIYPNRNYFEFKNKLSETKEYRKNLTVVAEFSDYLYGEFKVEETEYKVAINKEGFLSNFNMIIREKDSAFYKRNDKSYALFKPQDTFRINNDYFRYDTLSLNPSKLRIKKLKLNTPIYGFRNGDISMNYTVNDLDGVKSDFKSVLGDKRLLFVDFWGTWCGPCKELTPDLVKLHEKMIDKVSFMSLAFEMDPEPVREYAAKNNMDWYQGIINGKPKSGDMSDAIIGGLRIECYPTFLVLDREMKILFKGCGGGENFEKLMEILENYN